jgi:hypothetical protein
MELEFGKRGHGRRRRLIKARGGNLGMRAKSGSGVGARCGAAGVGFELQSHSGGSSGMTGGSHPSAAEGTGGCIGLIRWAAAGPEAVERRRG